MKPMSRKNPRFTQNIVGVENHGFTGYLCATLSLGFQLKIQFLVNIVKAWVLFIKNFERLL